MKQEKEELEKEKAMLDNSDAFAVQELAVKESDLGTLEKRIHNLRLQRTIAVQNIPQILLIKDGDAVLVSKIDDGINQAIPLWESQIVIGIQAMRQQAGAKISKSVSDTTNNILKKNAEALKQSAVNVAIENERSLVETETLINVNNSLIDTINGVRQAKKDGEKKREQSIQELAQIQIKLNQALIEAKS